MLNWCLGLGIIFGVCCITGYSKPKQYDGPKETNPVILVPGFGGSEIYVKLQNSKVPHFYCETSTADYFLLWLGVYYLLPHAFDCFAYNMRLIYDPKTQRMHSPEGVFIEIQNWGHTKSVEWISNVQLSPTAYFGNVVSTLVDKHGYKRDISIRGAPYDFRKAPNENADMIVALAKLVEDTFEVNGKKKVVLVGHSMGCLYSLHMLQQQTQAWKDKYIKAFVSASGPYGGSVKSIKTMSSGDNLNIPTLDANRMSNMSRTWPGQSYFLPHPTYWKADEVLGITNNKNYTVKNYADFYQDIGFPEGIEIYNNVYKLTNPRVPPGVEVHCVFSIDIPTAERYDWTGKNFPTDQPTEINGQGDGTVNIRSLNICLDWRKEQPQRVESFLLRKVNHLDTIKADEFVEYLKKVAMMY